MIVTIMDWSRGGKKKKKKRKKIVKRLYFHTGITVMIVNYNL